MIPLSAPGKVFLAGEYAVLTPGWPALVLAADRGMHAEVGTLAGGEVELWHRPSGVALQGELSPAGIRWLGGVPAELRFAAAAAELGARLCAEEGRAARGFSLAFLDDLGVAGPEGPLKLGLGGSACASVLAVRGACAAQGRALSPPEALALAHAAHWATQGGAGSGGDVAASALGGALAVRGKPAWESPAAALGGPARGLLADARVAAAPFALPDDARFLLAWSGAPADTRALVAEVRAFAAARPARFAALLEAIAFCAESLQVALESGARKTALVAVRRAAVAMAGLGEEAGCAIVTPRLARICAVAAAAGCAAKPSGAGGGDCAIVLGFGDEARDRAASALAAEGVLTFPIGVAEVAD
ncbi:MAG: phosphomevalonate kinase [Myxococcales bacterium]